MYKKVSTVFVSVYKEYVIKHWTFLNIFLVDMSSANFFDLTKSLEQNVFLFYVTMLTSN